MSSAARILIADDEEFFLHATADLLAREGYECVCASDGHAAAQRLKSEEFDLLIVDIRMPGNLDLQLVKEISAAQSPIPVILVTGFPSIETAVESIRLPVVAYFTKPVEFAHLLAEVERAVVKTRLARVARRLRLRLEACHEELRGLESDIALSLRSAERPGVELLEARLRGAVASLAEAAAQEGSTSLGRPSNSRACPVVSCPRARSLGAGIQDAVDVLASTKGSFRSPALGALRRRLVDLVGDQPAE
jgi:DNA-binding response OmpR family regulator